MIGKKIKKKFLKPIFTITIQDITNGFQNEYFIIDLYAKLVVNI